MKRIVASVGLVALGAASIQAQSSIAPPAAKWWSVSATVRGFYDDNIDTAPDSKHKTWGYDLSPQVGINVGNNQTTFIAGYTYSFLYYDDLPAGNTKKYDQNHIFTAALNHAFSERYSVHVRDAFVIGQEPDSLRAGNAISTPFRVSGNNIVNSGGIAFDAELTPLFGIEVGYDNGWYDYSDSFSAKGFTPPIIIPGTPPTVIPGTPSKNIDALGNISPSRSGLDRIEHTAHLDTRWHVMPETVARLGYQYGQINYTANELYQGTITSLGTAAVMSNIRDNRSHTAYAGVDHSFLPNLTGSFQAGATYYDYYNLNDTSIGPSANASLAYTYGPESVARIGFQQGRIPTDVVGASVLKDTETSVVFASLYHRIAPRFYGSLRGTFQNSIYNGGGPSFDGKSEQFYVFGADLEYKFNPHFSTHVGYDYDRLESEIPDRHYDRNKVYIGATATY